MLAADEDSSLFTYLVALIILVMAAVGLSLWVDQRSKSSLVRNDIRDEIAANSLEIEDLAKRHEALSDKLIERGTRCEAAITAHAKAKRLLAEQTLQRDSLLAKRDSLQQAIGQLEDDFDRCRRKVRQSASGENLGKLTTRDGREFTSASIARVTEIGLEIRHEHGIARLNPEDLDQKYQDRFQWSEKERRSGLEAENKLHGSLSSEPMSQGSIPETPPKPSPVHSQHEAEASEKNKTEQVQTLRREIAAWRSKISQIQSEKNTADSNNSYGARSSVPGSLETWAARSQRLGRELVRAQGALASSKSRLSILSPGDPALDTPNHVNEP